MTKIIGYLLLGFLFSWLSFMMFAGYYLHKRDEVITELLEENKRLRKTQDSLDYRKML